MKVLVTGANGFVGSWVLRGILNAGMEAEGFDLSPPGPRVSRLLGAALAQVAWTQGDVSCPQDVERAASRCGVTVHLAGVLTPFCRLDPVRGAIVNLLGTLHVFEAARKYGQRVIYASSAAVHGGAKASSLEPTTHYGAFKLACEGSGRSYWLDHQVASLGLRPFVVYGPGRDTGATAGVSLACEAALQNRPYTIPFTGRAGMVWVGDVVDAIIVALQRPFEGAHVMDMVGDLRSVDDVIAEIRRHCPGALLDAKGEPLPLDSDIPGSDGPPFMGTLPQTRLEHGILQTLNLLR